MESIAKSLEVLDEVLERGGGEEGGESGAAERLSDDFDAEQCGLGLVALAKQLREDSGFVKELGKAAGGAEVKKAEAISALERLGMMFGVSPEDDELYEGSFSWKVESAVRAIQQAAVVERAVAGMAAVMKSVTGSPRGDDDDSEDDGWDDEEDAPEGDEE